MKKFETILCVVFLLGFLAAGTVLPNQALAVVVGDPLFVPEIDECDDDLVMEQNGNANDGTSGDPDSIGDGFSFWDGTLLGTADGFIDGLGVTLEEYFCYLMKQIDPLQ